MAPKIREQKKHTQTKKLRKWPNNYRFAIFLFFFVVLYFRGPTRAGGFYIFFVIFRFSGIQGFLGSVPPPQDRNTKVFCSVEDTPLFSYSPSLGFSLLDAACLLTVGSFLLTIELLCLHFLERSAHNGTSLLTVKFENITFLIQKHFKTVTVTVILEIQFK